MRKGIAEINKQIKRTTWEPDPTPQRRCGVSTQAEQLMAQWEEDQRAARSASLMRGEHYYPPKRPTHAELLERQRRAEFRPSGRWVEECACGAPCHAHIDQDGQKVIESHASGIYGSDVPCFWAS